MADEHDAGEIPDETPTPAPAPVKPAPRERDLPDDPEELKRELQNARKALQAANKESAERRRLLEDVEAQKQQAKEKDLSEVDRLKKAAQDLRGKQTAAEQRAAQAESALIKVQVDHAVERAAAQMDFLYPDLVPRMLDDDEVTYDPETRKVEGVTKALERLVKNKPGLLRSGPGGGTPPRQGPRPQPFNGREPAPAPAQTPYGKAQPAYGRDASPIDQLLAGGGYQV